MKQLYNAESDHIVQTDWKQLRQLCFYELGWCYVFQFKVKTALLLIRLYRLM